MANIANIVAFDGASTPVSHTFTPIVINREKGVVTAEWRENVSGVPAYASPRVTMRMEKLKTGIYRVETRTVVPVMESISGQNAAGYTAAPKVAYENTDVHIGYFHERSDLTGRRLCRQLAINIAGNVSTTVTPATTGPAVELFDLLVMPT